MKDRQSKVMTSAGRRFGISGALKFFSFSYIFLSFSCVGLYSIEAVCSRSMGSGETLNNKTIPSTNFYLCPLLKLHGMERDSGASGVLECFSCRYLFSYFWALC